MSSEYLQPSNDQVKSRTDDGNAHIIAHEHHENVELPAECCHKLDIEKADDSISIAETSGNALNGDHPQSRQMKGWMWFLLSSAVLFATLLMALDNTIVADLQPQVVEALGEINKFPWINHTFDLGSVSTGLLWGKLYSSFDTKVMFVAGVVLFEVGSTISGAAPNMNAFIIGRAIGGVGANGLYLGAITIVARFTSSKEKAVYFSFFGISWGIGTLTGPLIGGLFTQSAAGWRWSFYLNLLFGAVVVPIYFFCLPNCKVDSEGSVWERVKRVDYTGAVLFAGAFMSPIMAVSFGGANYPWGSGQVIGLFCCAGFLWILFAIQQATTTFTSKRDRIFPASVLQDREMWILIVQTASAIAVQFVTLNYIPLYFQFVRGESAFRAAVDMLPLICVSIAAILLQGFMMQRFPYYMPWYLVGSMMAVVGVALIRETRVNATHGAVYGWSSLLSAGVCLYVQVAYPTSDSRAKTPQQASDAANVIGCTQLGAIAISLAVANSIFVNRAAGGLHTTLPDLPRAAVEAAIAGVGAPVFRDLAPAAKQQVLETVNGAIKDVWTQCLATASFSLVLSLAMKREKISTN
ncbi:MAG: hypothetical protein Q9162_003226 [Coniocarpon cinnabarinum]